MVTATVMMGPRACSIQLQLYGGNADQHHELTSATKIFCSSSFVISSSFHFSKSSSMSSSSSPSPRGATSKAPSWSMHSCTRFPKAAKCSYCLLPSAKMENFTPCKIAHVCSVAAFKQLPHVGACRCDLCWCIGKDAGMLYRELSALCGA